MKYFVKIHIYNIVLGKRALSLANTLDPFARGLHAHVSLFISTFSRLKKEKLGDAGPKTTTNWSVPALRG